MLSVRIGLSELVAMQKLGLDSEFADEAGPLTFSPQHVIGYCAQVAPVSAWRNDLMSIVSDPVKQPTV